MFKYDDNSGRITVKIEFGFSPRSWWGHTKWWFKYCFNIDKTRYWHKERIKAFREGSEKIWKEAEFRAIFGSDKDIRTLFGNEEILFKKWEGNK